MANGNQNEQNTTAADSIEGGAESVYFSQNVGVSFEDSNGIAKNPVVLDFMSKLDQDQITKENGLTTFPVAAETLAYFLHLVYARSSDGRLVQASFDGIFPFEAPEVEGGPLKKFNAQMLTIAEVDE